MGWLRGTGSPLGIATAPLPLSTSPPPSSAWFPATIPPHFPAAAASRMFIPAPAQTSQYRPQAEVSCPHSCSLPGLPVGFWKMLEVGDAARSQKDASRTRCIFRAGDWRKPGGSKGIRATQQDRLGDAAGRWAATKPSQCLPCKVDITQGTDDLRGAKHREKQEQPPLPPPPSSVPITAYRPQGSCCAHPPPPASWLCHSPPISG